jgi:hypothetical protein
MRSSADPTQSDRLLGQAAARFNAEGDVTLYVMPDTDTFAASATISAENLDQLVEAWRAHREVTS